MIYDKVHDNIDKLKTKMVINNQENLNDLYVKGKNLFDSVLDSIISDNKPMNAIYQRYIIDPKAGNLD